MITIYAPLLDFGISTTVADLSACGLLPPIFQNPSGRMRTTCDVISDHDQRPDMKFKKGVTKLHQRKRLLLTQTHHHNVLIEENTFLQQEFIAFNQERKSNESRQLYDSGGQGHYSESV